MIKAVSPAEMDLLFDRNLAIDRLREKFGMSFVEQREWTGVMRSQVDSIAKQMLGPLL